MNKELPKIPQKQQTMQNGVSTFLAGYMAGLVEAGKYTARDVIYEDYSNIDFGNTYRRYLRAYNNSPYHEDGLDKMFEAIRNKLNEESLK